MKKLIIAGGILLLLGTLAIAAHLKYNKHVQSPQVEIQKAFVQLTEARKSQVKGYKNAKLDKAERLYEKAVDTWKNENLRFFLVRNHDKARELAQQSYEISAQAIHSGNTTKKKITEDITQRIKLLSNAVKSSDALVQHLPLSRGQIKDFAKSKLLLAEAKEAWNRKEHQACDKLLEKSQSLLSKLFIDVRWSLRHYFESHSKWKTNANTAIKNSKQSGDKTILVDKMASKLYLYSKGNVVETYHCEFGPNWMKAKLYSGDKATPEGNYKISSKKNSSKYYLALTINYPNPTDQENYRKASKRNEIPYRRSIGSLIEIHGEGGKGAHWTQGCVALTNNDMKDLFKKVDSNTSVTIVGSIEPLDYYLNMLKL